MNLYNHNMNNENYIADYYIPSENDPIYPIGTTVKFYDERRRENICGEVISLSEDKQKYKIKLQDGSIYPKEFSVYERFDAKVYKPKNLVYIYIIFYFFFFFLLLLLLLLWI